MPSRLTAPVLKVDANLIHKVDTRNVENLFSMWTVFSKCSGSIEEGRRLENLSWRLWNRETFCCEAGEANATTPVISTAKRISEGRYTADVPDLSGSVDSIPDEEAIDLDNYDTVPNSNGLNINRPRIQRLDSSSSRHRGRERHITPDDLEKMVITIKEKKDLEPLDISDHSYLAPLAAKVAPTPVPTPQAPEVMAIPTIIAAAAVDANPASTDSSAAKLSPAVSTSSAATASSERSTTSVVRGFSPSHVSSSYRSIPLVNEPEEASPAPKSILTSAPRVPSSKAINKKHTVFALGGSSQSGDESFCEASSFENRMQQQPLPVQKKKPAMFSFGGSSGEDESSLRENMQQAPPHRSLLSGLNRPLQNKKQTSFKDEVAARTIHEDRVMDEDPFESDDEVDESAIDDDDDSSDWEDSIEESGKSSIDEKTFFQRVDSRANLTSRRSLITMQIHQKDRAAALANIASRSTPALQRSQRSSPNGPSLAASVESDDGALLMMKKAGARPGPEIPRSSAQPIIMTTTNVTPHQAALSPKTTRRNMLQTELTASLRRHLLWERQQKSSAVLKRRHTAQDMVNLKQYPQTPYMNQSDQDKDGHGSWNQYFSQGLGDFHSKGW